MSVQPDHLLIAPVLLPLLAAAAMLLLGERRRTAKAALNLSATLAGLGIAIALLLQADNETTAGAYTGVYLLGNWPAPFGIVLVLDRLSALMLVLTNTLAVAALFYALARWHRAGAHFHPLFQLQLMGLNGAFLTGDLFNLFVFFEVLLAASYGLLLHGSGAVRVRAGLHYIAVNLAASMLFLIGVALLYGVTGTLNMADLAARIPAVPAEDRMLLEAGAAILGMAFLIKAGLWPVCFWLPTAYAAATPPVAAVFAIMSKIGVYALLRLWLLCFGEQAGASALFGSDWLLYGGLATVAFGAIGVLASQNMGRLAGYSVLVSSGTVLAALGVDDAGVTSGAIYYLVVSTLSIGAFFLLIELVERGRNVGADVLAVTVEAFGDPDDDPSDDEIGVIIPASMAVLGLSFLCVGLLLAGLPPLSGFVGKFAILTNLLNTPAAEVPSSSWAILALLVLSGLTTLIAMTRAGIRAFWSPLVRTVPRVRVIEVAPIAALLLACMALTIHAGAALRYTQAAADALHTPQLYVKEVLGTPRVPPFQEGGL